MLELRGYITNLGKYNEGFLIGEWVTFPIDEEELKEVLKRIGINQEYDEFFFTDYDCNFDHNFGEYESINTLNEIAEKLEALTTYEKETFLAACELWNIEEVLNNDINDYILLSEVNTDYDLGFYWIEESGCYNLENLGNLKHYIDYEAFGRDVRLESNGGFTEYGFIEYVG